MLDGVALGCRWRKAKVPGHSATIGPGVAVLVDGLTKNCEDS
jgi:hypothetical protein